MASAEGAGLSRGGTSPVTGDGHARICERFGAKFPGPTWQSRKQNQAKPVCSGNGESRVDRPPGEHSYCACSRSYSSEVLLEPRYHALLTSAI
jgi:hypothetical protein